MRLLIVEDDDDLRAVLQGAMSQSDFEVDTAKDGLQALQMLQGANYDLAIIDLGLPQMDGMTLLRNLRRKTYSLPVLIVTARDALEDRVGGLDAGADDYLVKPFELVELEARVRALLRRHRADRSAEVSIGPLTFTPGQPRIMLDGTPIDLTASEFSLLELLALRSGRVVRRDEIANRLARNGEPPSDAAIDICVHRLRRRLEPCGLKVRTLRGFGYLLEKQEASDA
ncbi:MAG TPA: response regulator [Candidatus Acidoferrum sp.]|nr:response regulator [Candidatus Acidoferrum sp.]